MDLYGFFSTCIQAFLSELHCLQAETGVCTGVCDCVYWNEIIENERWIPCLYKSLVKPKDITYPYPLYYNMCSYN